MLFSVKVEAGWAQAMILSFNGIALEKGGRRRAAEAMRVCIASDVQVAAQ